MTPPMNTPMNESRTCFRFSNNNYCIRYRVGRILRHLRHKKVIDFAYSTAQHISKQVPMTFWNVWHVVGSYSVFLSFFASGIEKYFWAVFVWHGAHRFRLHIITNGLLRLGDPVALFNSCANCLLDSNLNSMYALGWHIYNYNYGISDVKNVCGHVIIEFAVGSCTLQFKVSAVEFNLIYD